jgi:hypothetical protein
MSYNNQKRMANRYFGSKVRKLMQYKAFNAWKSYIEKFFYIRFYGGHIHIRPLILEKRLHETAAIYFERYRSEYGHRRCFVIGNGPSLNKIDMTKLKDEVTIGSNGIYLNYKKMGFHPTFFTVVNYLIAEQMGPDILMNTESNHIYPSFLRRYFKDFQGQVIYLNSESGFKASNDVTRWISWQSTVTFFNLQIAYSLNCPEVYLIGVDNSYKPCTGGYDGKLIVQSSENDSNHFSANYFQKGFRWQQADTKNMEKCYKLIYDMFASDNRKITNATPEGKLEVFPRVDYNSIF